MDKIVRRMKNCWEEIQKCEEKTTKIYFTIKRFLSQSESDTGTAHVYYEWAQGSKKKNFTTF